MKELPDVQPFPIDKEIHNSQDRFYGTSELLSNEKVNVISKINQIFSSSNHIYKSRVKIKLKNDSIERTIIGKTNTDLLTLSGDKISIKDILDINKI